MVQVNNVVKPPRKVFDYDYMSNTGLPLSITIDPESGDSITFTEDGSKVIFFIAEKDMPASPGGKYPEEEIVVYLNNMIACRKRSRLVETPTVEQREEWKDTLNKILEFQKRNQDATRLR